MVASEAIEFIHVPADFLSKTLPGDVFGGIG